MNQLEPVVIREHARARSISCIASDSQRICNLNTPAKIGVTGECGDGIARRWRRRRCHEVADIPRRDVEDRVCHDALTVRSRLPTLEADARETGYAQ